MAVGLMAVVGTTLLLVWQRRQEGGMRGGVRRTRGEGGETDEDEPEVAGLFERPKIPAPAEKSPHVRGKHAPASHDFCDEEETAEDPVEHPYMTPSRRALRAKREIPFSSSRYEIDAPTPSSLRQQLAARTDEDRLVAGRALVVEGRVVIFDAIFDGHGGTFASDWLATHCRSHLSAQLTLSPQMELDKLLADVIEALDRDLVRELCWNEKIQCGAAGSIVLTERLDGDVLSIACGNLGDCDVKILGPQTCRQISVTHRLSNAAELDRITQLNGHVTETKRMCQLIKFREPSEDEHKNLLNWNASGVAWGGSTHFR